ncbi:MAG: hypothetical protein EON54_17945, partial [Alcaligenaceae bacterium]
MSEPLILQLLNMAERWSNAMGTTLRHRARFKPTAFAVTRRPEERALLAAAVEVFDQVIALPEGAEVARHLHLNGVGLRRDAAALRARHGGQRQHPRGGVISGT